MKLLRVLTLAVFLFIPLFGITYDIAHTNAEVLYNNHVSSTFASNIWGMKLVTNGAGAAYTNTNIIITNVPVNELPVVRFVLTTNGGPLYAGSNFQMNIRALDINGYHVTFAAATNLVFSSLDTNFAATSTNMAVTNFSFLSPSATFPDYDGSNFSTSYPVPGMIYIRVDQNTNTNVYTNMFTNSPGLLWIMPGIMAGVVEFDRVSYFGFGDRIFITVTDSDRNLDYGALDTITVNVNSTAYAPMKPRTLIETGPNTGIFTNTMFFETAPTGAANSIYVTNNASVFAYYADVQPVTNTSTNGLFRDIMTLVVTNPYFIRTNTVTNMRILGVDSAFVTNDVSDQFIYTSDIPSIAVVTASNEVRTIKSGLGRVSARHSMVPSLATNSVFLVTVQTQDTAVFASGMLSVTVPSNAFSNDVYVDVRKPADYQYLYTVTNRLADIAAADSGNTAGTAVLAASMHQLGAIESNLGYYPGLLTNNMTLEFTYTDADLMSGGTITAGESLTVVMLVPTNSTFAWVDVPGATNDLANKKVRVAVNSTGVYALRGRVNKIAPNSDLTRVGSYPNPFDLRLSPSMYIINLPLDVQYVKIYTADGRIVRTLLPGRGIGQVEVRGVRFNGASWDGKDENNNLVRSGLYLMEVRTPNTAVVKKFGLKR